MSSIRSLDELDIVATPAATMRTYAGSTTRPSADVAVWRSELPVGTPGPVHVVDRDHVVVVLDGALHVEMDGETTVVPKGGAVVLTAGAT